MAVAAKPVHRRRRMSMLRSARTALSVAGDARPLGPPQLWVKKEHHMNRRVAVALLLALLMSGNLSVTSAQGSRRLSEARGAEYGTGLARGMGPRRRRGP